MFMLYYKKPVAIHEGKSGYVKTWRGQQIAMCEEKEPLQKYINSHKTTKSDYYIEEWPDHQ